jgi:hypothetical protein
MQQRQIEATVWAPMLVPNLGHPAPVQSCEDAPSRGKEERRANSYIHQSADFMNRVRQLLEK